MRKPEIGYSAARLLVGRPTITTGQFVKVQVAEETDQTPIGSPLKVLGDEGGEFIFHKKKK